MLPRKSQLALAAILAAIAFAVFAVYPEQRHNCAMGLTLGLVGLGMAFAVKDALVKKTAALPNGAATTTTAVIDLGHGSYGDLHANFELLIQAPACTTGQLGDGQTLVYTIEHDTDSAMGSAASIYGTLITQTGAGGAGAAAAEKKVRLPSDVNRYVRLKCVKTGASNASGVSMTLQPLF